jgi:hypothetical protein
MARLARYTQTTFGTTAGANQIAEFGSLAAGSPLTYTGGTITPTIVQALSQFASGWFAAIQGANSPAIEDMNALFYLAFYQLSYLFSLGVAEWDAGTTYYAGSIVQDGNGNLFVSLTNTNLNNALTSSTNWRGFTKSMNLVAVNPVSGVYASPYTMLSTDNGKCFLVNSANGAMQFNLPAPASMPQGFNFVIKDQAVNFGTNNCTMHRNAAEKFENLTADYVMQASGGEWEISTDNTNWFITGR